MEVPFLNDFNKLFAHVERLNPTTATRVDVSPDHHDVGAVLSRIKVHKAPGPDGVPGPVLRGTAGVLTDIFSLSLSCSTNLLQTHLHRPDDPKNSNPPSLSDYHPAPTITR